jgi:hypothetical protein
MQCFSNTCGTSSPEKEVNKVIIKRFRLEYGPANSAAGHLKPGKP